MSLKLQRSDRSYVLEDGLVCLSHVLYC
jgi:hypothetical protein